MNLKEKIIHAWNISAEGYSKKVVPSDFVSPGKEIWTDLLLSVAPAKGKMDILDVGTGPGVFATLLALEGHHVIGIDISEKMLEEARENSARYGASPEYIRMDTEDLSFPERSFDMIVSRNVVWIMQDPEAVYRKWLQILKPGGRIVVFDTGHGRTDFLTQFDHNNEKFIEDYKRRFGKEPPISFDRGRYEEARGWKRELKLTYAERPLWDVETLKKTGYINVHWTDVTSRASYTEELKFANKDRLFFRLCADRPVSGEEGPGEKKDGFRIVDRNKAYWTKRAPGYAAINREELDTDQAELWRSEICGRIRRHFPGTPQQQIRVLEVGTGPGFFAIILTKAGYRLTAIDLTPAMLEAARENAGQLAEEIDFREMNAEELEFDNNSFDVIVTRNLTWNLPHPDWAYREWNRVLKKGGLLLNYDANWYRYLFDEKARAAYEADRKNTVESGCPDGNIGKDFEVMEDIARGMPLSRILRPEWDIRLLTQLGFDVAADTSVWQKVWSETEKINYASTPLFLVEAVKE